MPMLLKAPALLKALATASPRVSPPRTPVVSHLIHGTVLLLWLALFARAFFLDGVFAWSAGIVYVLYDTVLLGFVFWQTLPLRHSQAYPEGSARCRIGVIVAAHNEASILPVTLAALAQQTDAPDEILIADDGSSDATAEVLASLYGLVAPVMGGISAPSPVLPSLRWLRLPHAGKAQALNIALTEIGTETVMTVDADTLLEPGGVGAMRRAFSADPRLVAATGIITPICAPSMGGQIMQWFQTYEYIRNFLSRYAWSQLDSLLLISGAFAGYRRQAVLDVGGFDDHCLVEDYELTHRLLRHGVQNGQRWRTAVLGDAQARTDAPSAVPAFLRQRRRWFGGFLQTQFWYRDMVGNRAYGWLGTLMLPVKAIDTLQPIYGLLGVGLLLFYALTGRLSILAPVGIVIGAKIAIDLAFHLWSVHLYRRWVGGRTKANIGSAILAALAEPFSFQILRHAGAASGWVMFLTGEKTWGAQARQGLTAPNMEAVVDPVMPVSTTGFAYPNGDQAASRARRAS